MGTNQGGDEESPVPKENLDSKTLPVSTFNESINPAESEPLLPISSGPDENSDIDVTKKTEHVFITDPSSKDQSFTFNR